MHNCNDIDECIDLSLNPCGNDECCVNKIGFAECRTGECGNFCGFEARLSKLFLFCFGYCNQEKE